MDFSRWLNFNMDITTTYQMLALLIFIAICFGGVSIIVSGKMRQEKLISAFYQDSISEVNNIIDKIEGKEATEGMLTKIERELKQARSSLTVNSYIVLMIVSCVGIIFLTNAILGSMILAFPVGLIGVLIPKFVVKAQREKYMEEFDYELIKVLRRMASVLRSGGSLENAITDVTNTLTIKEIVRDEFSTVLATFKGGFSIQEAFYKLYESVGSPDTKYLCIAIDIQLETGGDKAEVFDTIAQSISNRHLKSKHIKAKLKEVEVTVTVLTFMPFLFAGGLYYFNPHHFDYFRANFQGRLTGFLIIAFMISGYFINKRMSKVV